MKIQVGLKIMILSASALLFLNGLLKGDWSSGYDNQVDINVLTGKWDW